MENDREGMVLRRAHIVRPFPFARMQKMFGKFSDGRNIIVGCAAIHLGAPYGIDSICTFIFHSPFSIFNYSYLRTPHSYLALITNF